MAIGPKTPRKRAVKKVSAKADVSVTEVTSEEVKKPVRKKAAAIPVPVFQAAPDKPVAKTVRKKAAPAPVVEPVVAGDAPEDAEDRAGRNRRRRRGGRGRRKPGAEGAGTNDETGTDSTDESAEGSTHRRRRRRVAGSEGVTPGESVEEDGVITVVKVREVRERPVRPSRGDRADRTERRGTRRDRTDRGGRSEYREPYRKRGTVITDGEFLARRENVDREMLVRQIADRTQIAVIEDGIMVEHYVNRNSNVSYVGNVYLGRVQNVLPSMEAALVDIGKGRNGVLYAGEVNWDGAGISESQPRKIETVLRGGQSVLV